MTRPFVWTLIGCLVAVSIVGATYAYPEWPLEAGFDFWNAPRYENEIEQCRRINAELDLLRTAARNRMEVKQAIANLVLTRRLTLAEGAAQFRDLADCGPVFLTVLRRIYPGLNDHELYCRNVIDTVKSLPVPDADWKPAVARLNEELKALKRQGAGEVRLPD